MSKAIGCLHILVYSAEAHMRFYHFRDKLLYLPEVLQQELLSVLTWEYNLVEICPVTFVDWNCRCSLKRNVKIFEKLDFISPTNMCCCFMQIVHRWDHLPSMHYAVVSDPIRFWWPKCAIFKTHFLILVGYVLEGYIQYL